MRKIFVQGILCMMISATVTVVSLESMYHSNNSIVVQAEENALLNDYQSISDLYKSNPLYNHEIELKNIYLCSESDELFEVSETEEIDYRSVQTPKRDRDFKSYLSYTKIKKWSQKDLQDLAYDGEYGIRQVNNRFCVAVGTGAGAEIGQYIDLVLENGTVINCIVADTKQDVHTDNETHLMTSNQCVSEFIINDSIVEKRVLRSGNISNVCEDWKSPVVEIRVYEYNYLTEYKENKV